MLQNVWKSAGCPFRHELSVEFNFEKKKILHLMEFSNFEYLRFTGNKIIDFFLKHYGFSQIV